MRVILVGSWCLCVFILHINTTLSAPDPNGEDVCNQTVTFTENYQTQCQTSYRSSYTTWCWDVWSLFRCTKYRTKYRMTPCTRTRKANRIEYFCCPGYNETTDRKCEPVCNPGCVHGMCIKPDMCLCDPGWQGTNCTKVCTDGFWGQDCNHTCTCVNGGICDSVNGTCACPPGYFGENCEEECPTGRYGLDCQETCQCQNGAECDHINGSCTCQPGYRGEFCEEPCPEGRYGIQCPNYCRCQNGATCDPRDGSCHCGPGWMENLCDERCSYGYYGFRCQHRCLCQENGSSDAITGKCNCPPGFVGDRCEKECDCVHSMLCEYIDGGCECKPGWTGKRCTSTCAKGYYGQGCTETCYCEHGYCDPITGQCQCDPGYDGEKCEKSCQKWKFGLRCAQSCQCDRIRSVDCDSTDGRCICKEGWHGLYCKSQCPEGYWGKTCEKHCECEHDGSCDAETGKCECVSGWTGEQCSKTCAINNFGAGCSQFCFDCEEVNLTCSPQSGVCVCGYDVFGNQCQYGCPIGTHGVGCRDIDPLLLIPIISGTLSATIIVISISVGLVLWYRRTHKSKDKPSKPESINSVYVEDTEASGYGMSCDKVLDMDMNIMAENYAYVDPCVSSGSCQNKSTENPFYTTVDGYDGLLTNGNINGSYADLQESKNKNVQDTFSDSHNPDKEENNDNTGSFDDKDTSLTETEQKHTYSVIYDEGGAFPTGSSNGNTLQTLPKYHRNTMYPVDDPDDCK